MVHRSTSKGQQKVANTIGDIVKEYPNCQFVNMLNKGLIDYDTDISPDDVHLNYSGALKVSTWLGEYLNENYDLDDYSDNASWKRDYEEHYHYKKERIKKETTLPEYLVMLSDPDFYAELDFYSSKLLDSKRLMQLCKNADVEPKLDERESKYCAHLTIKSSITDEVVEEVDFTCKNLNKIKILDIVESED